MTQEQLKAMDTVKVMIEEFEYENEKMIESVYSACKAGVIGLTKSLSVEASPFVRVNAIAPGCIETKMTNNLSKTDKDCVIDSTPLDRLGEPEDVANAVFFLASDQSSFITGEVLEITGGAVRF